MNIFLLLPQHLFFVELQTLNRLTGTTKQAVQHTSMSPNIHLGCSQYMVMEWKKYIQVPLPRHSYKK